MELQRPWLYINEKNWLYMWSERGWQRRSIWPDGRSFSTDFANWDIWRWSLSAPSFSKLKSIRTNLLSCLLSHRCSNQLRHRVSKDIPVHAREPHLIFMLLWFLLKLFTFWQFWFKHPVYVSWQSSLPSCDWANKSILLHHWKVLVDKEVKTCVGALILWLILSAAQNIWSGHARQP